MLERGRFRGALVGLAVGDALGTPLEGRMPGSFEPIEALMGGGPYGLAAGEWTDDTSMALCLADSLIERQAFNLQDQMQRYLRWYRDGERSVRGACFAIDDTVRDALERYEAGESGALAGAMDEESAGNGSLMRLAPVAMRFAGEPEKAMRYAGESSKTTHGARAAVDACRYYGGLMVRALRGESKSGLLGREYSPVEGYFEAEPLVEVVAEVARGSYREKEPPEIVGSGYVVRSMEAALWAFAGSEDFRCGALRAVNLGNDAGTTGAIYGQLAGAYYGIAGIPGEWREKIYEMQELVRVADALFEIAMRVADARQ